MFLTLAFLSACRGPCHERAGVYSLLDDNGLEWNLRMAPGTAYYADIKTMDYTLGVQVPAYDNASAFIVSETFSKKTCRQERVPLAGTFTGGTEVEGVGFNQGEVEGVIDRDGTFSLSYSVNLLTPDGQQALAAEVTVPRVSSLEDWTGDTGDSWY